MSAEFTGAARAADNLDDTPYEASAEVPPWLKLAIGTLQFFFGLFTNFLQVITSVVGILAMIFGSEVKGMNLADVLHTLGWQFFIGIVIAGGVQGFLHKNAMSLSSTLRRIRTVQGLGMKSHAAKSAVKQVQYLDWFFLAMTLIAEIVSDLFFVRLFTDNPLILLLWVVFVTGCSTKLMYHGAMAMWGAIEDSKDYAAYHRKNDHPTAKQGA